MKRKVILLSICGLSFISFGQNVTNLNFSRPQILNPALTGIFEEAQFNLGSSLMFGRFNTTYLDYSQYSNKLHGGIGIHTNNFVYKYPDNSLYRSHSLSFSYAYQNRINNKWNYSLGSSFEIGTTSNSIEMPKFKFGYQFGGLIYSKSFFASVSYGQSAINENNIFKESLLNTTLGYKFKPFHNLYLSLTPSISYTHQYNSGKINTNLEAQYKNLHLGIGYGNGRPNASVGYDFKRFKLNYNMGNISNTFTSPEYIMHEFSIKFKLNNKLRSTKSSSFNFNLF